MFMFALYYIALEIYVYALDKCTLTFSFTSLKWSFFAGQFV